MSAFVQQAETDIRSKLVRALIGGFVGTLLFSLMGKFVAPVMIGQPMDVAVIIAGALGIPLATAAIAHFVVGTVAFPFAYLVIGIRHLPGPGWMRGGIFLILVYFVAMLVIMPMLGQGFFLSSAPKAMVAFVGHVVLGLSMGAIIGKPTDP
jgi:hypothetical protein